MTCLLNLAGKYARFWHHASFWSAPLTVGVGGVGRPNTLLGFVLAPVLTILSSALNRWSSSVASTTVS